MIPFYVKKKCSTAFCRHSRHFSSIIAVLVTISKCRAFQDTGMKDRIRNKRTWAKSIVSLTGGSDGTVPEPQKDLNITTKSQSESGRVGASKMWTFSELEDYVTSSPRDEFGRPTVYESLGHFVSNSMRPGTLF